jgi:threonine/homoserine/homoserine lactone efflux protein
MEIPFFIKGLLIGFSIAAPVGPIGILCIRRTLAEGRLTGFISGLGAASADAFYGSVAAFGLTAVSGFLISQRSWMQLLGGAFLIYLGIRTFRSIPADQAGSEQTQGLFSAFLSTFLLTLTNPMTIISFTAIFAGLGLGQSQGDLNEALQLVVGVFLGSAAWWFTLSFLVGIFKTRINERTLVWVNRIAGVFILGFGIGVFINLYFLSGDFWRHK